MRRCLLLSCFWIMSTLLVHAQNMTRKISGHWVHKYGLHLDLSDSTKWQFLNYSGGQCALIEDTLIVRGILQYPYFYIGTDSLSKMNSGVVQNSAIFKIQAFKDSLVLTPLNYWGIHFITDFGMSHAPMLWHLTPERPNYFPQKALHRDKLVFYTPEQMADTIPWNKLYFSIHRNAYYLFPESNFDLTIFRNGLVQIDGESGITDAYDEDRLQNRKSYELQLSPRQMDTLVHLLQIRNIFINQNKPENSNAYDLEYRLRFGDDDAFFSWKTSKESPRLSEITAFMDALINHSGKKEIAFAGFKSPCTFVKTRN
jgi:hypothetical protein